MNEEDYNFRPYSEGPQYTGSDFQNQGNRQIMTTYSGKEGDYLTFDRNRLRGGQEGLYNNRDDVPGYSEEDALLESGLPLTSGLNQA